MPDDLTDLFQNSLRTHARNAPAASPSMAADSRRRACRIRRRRQLVTMSVACAAALAVVVPSAVFSVRQKASVRVDPPPVASAPAYFSNGVVTIDFDRIPSGKAALPYWTAREQLIHDGDNEVLLPFEPHELAAVGEPGYDRRYAVVGARPKGGDAKNRIWLLDSIGKWTSLGEDVSSLVVSDDRSRLGWTGSSGPDGRKILITEVSNGGKVKRFNVSGAKDDSTNYDPVGFVGNDTVLAGSRYGALLMDRHAFGTIASSVRLLATSPEAGLIAASFATEDVCRRRECGRELLAKIKSQTADRGWCRGVIDFSRDDRKSEEVRIDLTDEKKYPRGWGSCSEIPVNFSPDGRYLVVRSVETTIGSVPSYKIIDLETRKQRLEIRADRIGAAGSAGIAWSEDGTRVGVEATVGGKTGIVECSVDGECATVTAPVSGARPYVLATD